MTPWDSSAKALEEQIGMCSLLSCSLSPQDAAEPSVWPLPPGHLPSKAAPHQASFEGPWWVSQGTTGDMGQALGRKSKHTSSMVRKCLGK